MLTEMTCAAPAYIDRFGMPASVDALDGHRMVGFRSSATGALLPLEFVRDGVVRHVDLPATVAVNGAESLVAAGRLGLGLIQVPRYHAIGSFHPASACSSTGSSGCLPAAKADAPGPVVRLSSDL